MSSHKSQLKEKNWQTANKNTRTNFWLLHDFFFLPPIPFSRPTLPSFREPKLNLETLPGKAERRDTYSFACNIDSCHENPPENSICHPSQMFESDFPLKMMMLLLMPCLRSPSGFLYRLLYLFSTGGISTVKDPTVSFDAQGYVYNFF